MESKSSIPTAYVFRLTSKSSADSSWRSIQQRYGAQCGPLDAFLRSRGPFLIDSSSPTMFVIASQIARNLYQYFGADSEIIRYQSQDPSQRPSGNIVSLSVGPEVGLLAVGEHPISIVEGKGVGVRDASDYTRFYPFEFGLGAIFLKPLPEERLELVIWGFDESGLRQAARLVPMLTGVGQPEFIISSKEKAWKGIAGVLAMGSFDHHWNASSASFFT